MSSLDEARLMELPGGNLVCKGISDLGAGLSSEEALLVLIAQPRLTGLGISVPNLPGATLPVEHRLFEALEERLGAGAHQAYNSLIQRIVSFANAYPTLRE